MNAEQLNIDDFVNYEAEYKSVIKGAKPSGNSLVGRCPFHDDKKNSFSADLKTGQWHCFSEDRGGNFISFWAELNGVDTKEAYKQILEKYGKLDEPDQKKQPSKPKHKNYTLAEYAFYKHLPEDFLKDACGITTEKDKDGAQYLKMPYFNEENTTPIFRKRYGDKEFRWSWGSSGKLILYGDWRLPEIREAGWTVLAEGESDTQTLWFLKVSALGVPGAGNFNARMVPKLQDLKLYIHQEPDDGGKTFLAKICRILREEGFIGRVYTWSCRQFGVKDPSELYLRDGAEKAAEKIQKAIRNAKQIDLDDPSDTVPEAIKGAPVNLRQPEGWIYSEKGISRIDEKKAAPTMICRTPVILTKRLKSMETGEEKIEVAFKRDGQWSRAIYPRSTVFTSRNITALADLGCTITSENAKQVVRFLEALEAENIDIIQKADSTSTFGWQTKGRFLPGYGDGIVLDIEPSLRGWAAAYHTSGTFQGWIDAMRPHRNRDKFRFILAAGFAAPLLRIIQQRIFFVYNWGGSKGGKAQPLDTRIITPNGYVSMRNIKVGDMVIGWDGKAHPVTAIYPQGTKDVYELSFSDGTKTKCCKEHLWTVTTETRRQHHRGYTVMELSDMLESPIKKGAGYNFRIPVCEAVEYTVHPKLRIAPYLLGALLGDGCITASRGRIYFNNSEQDVIMRVENAVLSVGGHLRYNPYSTNQYEISGASSLKKAISEYGLNQRSENKFIPSDYLLASIEERKELLAGLMDTDGSVEKQSGSFKYSTTSERLARDLQELCRSLGYRTGRITRKKSKQGRFDELVITINTDELIFKSRKHISRIPKHKRKTDKKSIAITDIRHIGKEECQCIMVDSVDHTYLCDDFIVTHNTAALKAALSAWGDPERLMVNFNATQVALERMAGFYNDLPLGIDERQLAGQKQENLEKIVYMIASGTGRARGSKSGGLQALNTWRTIAIATGEEPLSTDTTQTGVSTRVLEIYGAPFDNEKSASLMHQQAPANCGWAGPEFISRLLATDERTITNQYKKMTEEIYAVANGTSGAHIAGISAVALADAVIDTWIFGNEADENRNEAEQNGENCDQNSGNRKQPLEIRDESWQRAVQMAKAIIQEQLAAGVSDVNENATQFIVDWILSNRAQFGDKAIGTCLGTISSDQSKAYIFPSLLNQALTKAGYSPRKTMKYLADKNIITSTPKANGGKEYCVRKWFDNRTSRFIEFDLKRFSKPIDPLDEDEAAEAAGIEEKQKEGEWRQLSTEEWKQLESDFKTPFDEETELPY